MFVISLRMSIHLLNLYLHVVFFSFFFTSFGGSFKGFDNYHDCVKKNQAGKGNGTFRRKLSDKEHKCFKHFICNISNRFSDEHILSSFGQL